jgi:hypothetical protein
VPLRQALDLQSGGGAGEQGCAVDRVLVPLHIRARAESIFGQRIAGPSSASVNHGKRRIKDATVNAVVSPTTTATNVACVPNPRMMPLICLSE